MDASPEFVKELLPSVVNIHTTVPRGHPSARVLGEERMGSGLIVDSGGLILTVNYTVMGASVVDVAPLKGRRMRAEVVAIDFEVGLALLRVKRQGLPAATLAAGPGPERGEAVIAIASPGVQEVRVSGGIVTYLGEFEAYWEYLLERGIVSTAPNPGNGGGGLFTMNGRAVGVLYLNLNEVARASLAIPVDCYRDTAEELLRYGRVVSRPRRAWLGVFATPLDDGVVIAGVVPGGPGEKGGLREGDMVVSLNAQGVSTRRELYSNLWRHEPGERLTIEVMRDNALRRLEITGGDRADFFKPV
ncbi:MAG TPA: S1C family serine protease [Methylomirabilota bacterium]|nr:S1C family serine protease [Methylomirabilota bacterium]